MIIKTHIYQQIFCIKNNQHYMNKKYMNKKYMKIKLYKSKNSFHQSSNLLTIHYNYYFYKISNILFLKIKLHLN